MRWKDNIINWFYPLFAFLLPFQTRWIVRDAMIGGSVWEYGRVSVYSFDIVLIFINLLIYWFIVRRKEGKWGRRELRYWVIGVGILFVMYELLVSLDWVLSAAVLVRLLLIGVAGWRLVRWADVITARRTLAAFVVAMTLSAGFGVAQFLAQSSLVSSKWLGVSWQEASQAGASVVETIDGRWLRAHGTMPHPNALGGFSAIALIMFLILIAVRESHRSLPHPVTLRGKVLTFARNVFVIVAPLILLAGVITSASRGAIIATLLGMGIWVWQHVQSRGERLFAPTLITIAGGLLIILFIAWPLLLTRFTAQGRLESLSIRKRTSAFVEAGEVLKKYGIKGTGLGAYTVALQRLYSNKPVWEQQPVHNVALLLLAELGFGGVLIVGLGWLLAKRYLVSGIWYLGNESRINSKFEHLNNPQPNTKYQIPVLTCWLTLALLDHYLWTLPAGLYLSGLLLLLNVSKAPLDKNLPSF